MNKKLIKAAVIGALFSVAPMSFAADEVEDVKAPSMLDDFSFSGNVGLYSDYIFRGYTQTQNEPAIQGGFDVEHSSGLYAGTWASNVDWTTSGGYMDKNSKVYIQIIYSVATLRHRMSLRFKVDLM